MSANIQDRWSISEPEPWDQFVDSDWKWDNIQMKRLVADELPENAVEGIRRVVQVNEVDGQSIVDVKRHDKYSVEIVYYGDEFDEDRPDGEGPTKIPAWIIEEIQDLLCEFFGPLWRVGRKEDSRRYSNESVQRLIVQRIIAQEFRYRDESHAEWLFALNGSPDGVPDDARRYKDLDAISDLPENVHWFDLDLFVHESSTGTKHLIRGGGVVDGLRRSWIVDDVSCLCGVSVDSETIIDGDVAHLAAHTRFEVDRVGGPDIDPYWTNPTPERIFGDDLCRSCWRSYCGVNEDGSVKDPNVAYRPLLKWARDEGLILDG